MTSLTVFVAALTVYRLTMLVTADVLTQPVRDRLFSRYVHPVHELTDLPRPDTPKWEDGFQFSAVCRCGARFVGNEWSDVMSDANDHVRQHHGETTRAPKWLTLVDCPWCVSFHLGLPVAWSAWCFGDRSWWFVPAGAFAFSAVTGILATYAKPESP